MALPLRQPRAILGRHSICGTHADTLRMPPEPAASSSPFNQIHRTTCAAHADYRRRGVLGSLLRPWATDFNMPALSRTATSPTTCDNCPEIDYARHMPSVQQVRHIETRNDHAAACQDNSGPSGNNGECNIANGALNTIYRNAG